MPQQDIALHHTTPGKNEDVTTTLLLKASGRIDLTRITNFGSSVSVRQVTLDEHGNVKVALLPYLPEGEAHNSASELASQGKFGFVGDSVGMNRNIIASMTQRIRTLAVSLRDKQYLSNDHAAGIGSVMNATFDDMRGQMERQTRPNEFQGMRR